MRIRLFVGVAVAATLLAGGDAGGALQQARAVLAKWPNDPMSLLVVARAEAALGHADAAREAMAKAQAGWSGGPVEAISLNEI